MELSRKHPFPVVVSLFLVLLASCAPQAVPPSSSPATHPPPTLAPSPTLVPPTSTPNLPTPTPVLTSIPPGSMDDLDRWLSGLARQGLFSGSVLVARQGVVLLSQGYGLADRENGLPNTPRTRYRIGSLTKQFTAAAVLILASQGKLAVSDPICRYLDDCPAAWGAITIHHLLAHTSGIPNFTALPDYLALRGFPSTPQETIARFRDLSLDFQPGESWNYSNSGYIILGAIIEKASGQAYADFLQQEIFTPLGLQDTGYDHNSASLAVGYVDGYSNRSAANIDMSIPYAAGALYASVEDLYTWEQALYTDALLPYEYLDAMFSPQVPIPDSNGLSYGYGWMVGEFRSRAIQWHNGSIEGFRSALIRFPDERLSIIILCNRENIDLNLLLNVIYEKIFGEE